MVDGCRREQWEHTSHILAMLVNVNRDPKKGRAVSAAELNPFMVEEARKNRPTISDPGQLARLLGVQVEDDAARAKRRAEHKARRDAERSRKRGE